MATTVGWAGATASTVTVVALETLVAGSVAVRDSTVPSAGTAAGMQDHTPEPLATAVHTGPAGDETVTVEPASAVPEMGEPSVGATVGTGGAVWSTVTGVAVEMLPAASAAVIDSTVPLAGTVAGMQDHAPVTASAVVVHTEPEGDETVTVEPASAVPLIGEPSVADATGGTGAV